MDPENDGDENDVERLMLLYGKFLLTLLATHKGRRFRNGLHMTALELRRYFRSQAIVRELKRYTFSRLNGNDSRIVPNMQEVCSEELEITITDFINTFGEELQETKYRVERAEVNRRFANILTPASDLFYCLHCQSTVHINPQFKCPQCFGWCLLEMDPNNDQDIPSLPLESYMIKTHRRSLPSNRRTDIRNDVRTSIRLTQDHVDQNMECSICLNKFKVGKRAVHIICGHLFHRKCIEKWFNTDGNQHKPQCPHCRASMPTSDSLLNICLRVRAIEGRYAPPPPHSMKTTP